MKRNKRFVFIIHSSPSNAPYLQYYFNVLDKHNIQYDVICRRKYGEDIKNKERLLIYDVPTRNDYPIWRKFFEFLGFYKFSVKQLKKVKYDGVFIYTISTALFFYWVLQKNYKGKYVFDIRDYSRLLRYPIVTRIVHNLLKNSDFNSISSFGFKEWLPKDIKYIKSHNINIDSLEEQSPFTEHNASIKILTIGSIRDYNSNLDFIKGVANDSRYALSFIGRSIVSGKLENYVNSNRIQNVTFQGTYLKEDELNIVSEHDMINIFLPDNILSNYLMSNRFYLSVVMRKPMIVNDNSYQAKISKKYGLGVIIKNTSNLSHKIEKYWEGFNPIEYNNNCIRYIEDVKNDIYIFEKKVESFIGAE